MIVTAAKPLYDLELVPRMGGEGNVTALARHRDPVRAGPDEADGSSRLFVALAGAFLYGLHWITRRRDEVQAALAEVPKPPQTAASIPWARSLWDRFTGKAPRS